MSNQPFLITKFSQCTSEEQSLLTEAAHVRLRAQAPYSNYYVGAAVLSTTGAIYRGCNVERCSYTQTTHAEQNAIDTMIAHEGPSKVTLVALVGASVNNSSTANEAHPTRIEATAISCGYCLQIIWENCFGDPDVKIISLLAKGNVINTTIGQALPMRFEPANLGVSYTEKSLEAE